MIIGDGISAGKYKSDIEQQTKNDLEECFLITGWEDDSVAYIGIFDVGIVEPLGEVRFSL